MPETDVRDRVDESVRAGQAPYSRAFLAVYDAIALNFFMPYVWRCPAREVLGLYDRHVSANHLDVGAGTGWFLDRCQFPAEKPRLVLMDLNPNGLAKCQERLARFQPTCL